jgi:hypothetical protein
VLPAAFSVSTTTGAEAHPPAPGSPRALGAADGQADGGAWLRPWYAHALEGLEVHADAAVEAALQLEPPQRALSYASVASVQRVRPGSPVACRSGFGSRDAPRRMRMRRCKRICGCGAVRASGGGSLSRGRVRACCGGGGRWHGPV